MVQAVQRHIPILVRTMGSSSGLLEIISDPPSGSESLLMQVLFYKHLCNLFDIKQKIKVTLSDKSFLSPPLLLHQVLHTLTDGTVPSPELIFTIRKLYDSKLKV